MILTNDILFSSLFLNYCIIIVEDLGIRKCDQRTTKVNFFSAVSRD